MNKSELNMNEIKIEKGIPVPPGKTTGNRYGCWVEVIRRMEIGDSIVVPAPAMGAIYPSCKRNGWKIRTRTQPFQKGEKLASVRVWLVGVVTDGPKQNV